MSKELQSLNERIAERIGKDLIELISADQWKLIIEHLQLVFTKITPELGEDDDEFIDADDGYFETAELEINVVCVN